MPARVSPTDRVRAKIDELFDSGHELPEILDEVARLGAQPAITVSADVHPNDLTGLEGGVDDGGSPGCPVRVDSDDDRIGRRWCHGRVFLLAFDNGVNAGRAHQLSALHASLQPLPVNGADPGARAADSVPLTVIEQVRMEAT